MGTSKPLKTAVMFVFFLILFLFWDDLHQLNIQEIVSETGNRTTAALIILGLFTAKSIFFFIPVVLIYTSTGMVFPLVTAILINILGLFIEFTLTFFYGYFLGYEYVEKITDKHEKLKKVLHKNREKITLPFWLRLSPLALEPVSLLFGATGKNYLHYIGASLMGAIPKLLTCTLIGNAVVTPVTTFSIIQLVAAFLIWIVAIYVFKKTHVNPQKNASG